MGELAMESRREQEAFPKTGALMGASMLTFLQKIDKVYPNLRRGYKDGVYTINLCIY